MRLSGILSLYLVYMRRILCHCDNNIANKKRHTIRVEEQVKENIIVKMTYVYLSFFMAAKTCTARQGITKILQNFVVCLQCFVTGDGPAADFTKLYATALVHLHSKSPGSELTRIWDTLTQIPGQTDQEMVWPPGTQIRVNSDPRKLECAQRLTQLEITLTLSAPLLGLKKKYIKWNNS